MVLGTKRKVVEPSSSTENDISGGDESDSEEDEQTLEPWPEFLRRSAKLVEDQLSAAGQEEWLVTWCRRKWRWAGKLVTRGHLKWSYAALLWDPSKHSSLGGRRAQARPFKRWEDDFNDALRARGIEETWIQVASDADLWQSLEEYFVNHVTHC